MKQEYLATNWIQWKGPVQLWYYVPNALHSEISVDLALKLDVLAKLKAPNYAKLLSVESLASQNYQLI